MKDILLFSDKVIVLEDKAPAASGGIALVDQEPPYTGLVVGVGCDVASVTEGDRVFFGKKVGVLITLDGVEYVIMKEIDVQGVFEDL